MKIGAMYFPNKPLELTSVEYNGGAYAEASKQSKSLTSIHGHANMPFFQLINGFGCDFGLDFDNKEASGASHDESLTLSGRNTTSGSSQIELRISKQSTPQTFDPEITLIFQSDNVIKITGGVAVPVERS